VAEQERQRSTQYAVIARGAAGGFTAVGTVLMGNWKKPLGCSSEEEEVGKK
jgi:hypothetical protein